MTYRILLLFCMCCVICCGPHSHKVSSNKISLEDNGRSRYDKHFKNGEHNHEFDHESILGSHDAAEEFDQLSPAESKQRLMQLALIMDKSKDGFVDDIELFEWVFYSFRMLTKEEAMDQLEDEDSDQDGKVTWEEHASETYGIYDDDTVDDNIIDEKETLTDEHKMLKNDKEIFQAADLNNDGVLDKSEFAYFSHPEEFEHMHEIIYKQAMDKRDKDKDGFLNFEEFIGDYNDSPSRKSSEHYILEEDRFKNDFDLDKNGKLSKEEVLLWLIPNNVEMAEAEANHLIESSDDDKDGKLSIQEIVNHHDIFVGSEATDFGEHLHNTHRFNDEL